MKYGVVGLLLVSLLTLGLTEYALPGIFAHEIEKSFRKQVEAVDSLDVKVSTHPAVMLLAGHIQNGEVHAKGVQIQGLKIAALDAVYKDLVFAKTPDGAMKAVSGTNTYFRAVFNEKDLNSYLQAKFAKFQNMNLEMAPGVAALNLQISVLNTSIPVHLKGKFTIPDNKTIRFALEGLELGKFSLSSPLVASVLQEVKFDLSLGEYPLPLVLRDVKVGNGLLEVLGGTSE